MIIDIFLYIEIANKLHHIQFNSKFKNFFIEKFFLLRCRCCFWAREAPFFSKRFTCELAQASPALKNDNTFCPERILYV